MQNKLDDNVQQHMMSFLAPSDLAKSTQVNKRLAVTADSTMIKKFKERAWEFEELFQGDSLIKPMYRKYIRHLTCVTNVENVTQCMMLSIQCKSLEN